MAGQGVIDTDFESIIRDLLGDDIKEHMAKISDQEVEIRFSTKQSKKNIQSLNDELSALQNRLEDLASAEHNLIRTKSSKVLQKDLNRSFKNITRDGDYTKKDIKDFVRNMWSAKNSGMDINASKDMDNLYDFYISKAKEARSEYADLYKMVTDLDKKMKSLSTEKTAISRGISDVYEKYSSEVSVLEAMESISLEGSKRTKGRLEYEDIINAQIDEIEMLQAELNSTLNILDEMRHAYEEQVSLVEELTQKQQILDGINDAVVLESSEYERIKSTNSGVLDTRISTSNLADVNSFSKEVSPVEQIISKIQELDAAINQKTESIEAERLAMEKASANEVENVEKISSSVQSLKMLLDDSANIFSSLNPSKNAAARLEDVEKVIKNIGDGIRDIPENGISFLNELGNITAQASELKNLASAIKESSKQIKDAKKTSDSNKKKSSDKKLSSSLKSQIKEAKSIAKIEKDIAKLGSSDSLKRKALEDKKRIVQDRYDILETEIKKYGEYEGKIAHQNTLENIRKETAADIKIIEADRLNTINKQNEKLQEQISAYGKLHGEYNSSSEAESAFRSIISGYKEIGKFTSEPIKNGMKFTTTIIDTDKQAKKLVGTFADGKLYTAIKSASTATSGWDKLLHGIGNRWQSLVQYISSFATFYQVWDWAKRGLDIVIDLNSALTEMRKVSDETLQTLEKYQFKSFDLADEVGTTAKQIQESTADWMRIGESLTEASESAKTSNVLLNVSEFDDINDATEALVAMSSAYKELDKGEIVDVLNKLGNEYAISTDGLATALQTSASALKTAQNDFYESAALATAANTVVQDPSQVGSALRTIALRLTGTDYAKQQLADLGEEVDDFVVTTSSKMNQKLIDLTKTQDKVGVSLLDMNGNYRSVYEVLLDVADVWDKIAEEDLITGENRQNALLEMMAGKNRANILSSVLASGDVLREAYQDALKASGSAQKELDAYLESLEARIQRLTNAAQKLAFISIDSGFVGGVIDGLTSVLSLLTDVIDKFGLLETLLVGAGGIAGAKGLGLAKSQSLQAPLHKVA